MGLLERVCCTFNVIVFKVILRSFNAIISKWPVTLKQVTVGRNRLKFGTCGLFVVHKYGSILDHLVYLFGIKEYLYKFTSVTYSCREAERQGVWTSCFHCR